MDDRAAVERIRSEQNESVRNALTGAFLRAKEGLVRKLTRKAASAEKTPEEIDDLLQAGRIGMLRAIDDWNPDKGALSTWAGWKIKRQVQDAARAAQPIALPQIRGTVAERDRVVKALRANPDVTADELGIPDGMLDRVKKTIGLRYVSVDMFGDGDDAPARARRIERRITEATEDDGDAEDIVDELTAARSVLDALKRCADVTHMTLDEVLAGAARALGVEIVKAPVSSPIEPRAKKARVACPCPTLSPSRPLLRPSTLPPPRLLARSESPRLVAHHLRSPSAPLRLLKPLPSSQLLTPRSSPAKLLCRAPRLCSRPTALFLPRFGTSCEPRSAASRAA